jgi:hypothetical protein
VGVAAGVIAPFQTWSLPASIGKWLKVKLELDLETVSSTPPVAPAPPVPAPPEPLAAPPLPAVVELLVLAPPTPLPAPPTPALVAPVVVALLAVPPAPVAELLPAVVVAPGPPLVVVAPLVAAPSADSPSELPQATLTENEDVSAMANRLSR